MHDSQTLTNGTQGTARGVGGGGGRGAKSKEFHGTLRHDRRSVTNGAHGMLLQYGRLAPYPQYPVGLWNACNEG